MMDARSQSFWEKVVSDRYILYYIIIIFLGKLWIGDKFIWRCMYNLGSDRQKQNVEKMNVHSFTSKLG
jgi:hypothetical protein